MIPRINKESLERDLVKIGLMVGDVVYIRADMSCIGRLDNRNSFLDSIFSIIGQTGTIVVPAFGKIFKKSEKMFPMDKVVTSGALSKLILSKEDSFRSRHPTHSIVSLGCKSHSIINSISNFGEPFEFVKTLLDFNAKMIVIGSGKVSPGFSTVHYAQSVLGLSRLHVERYFNCGIYEQDGLTKIYRFNDYPGCSAGFDKMYRHYINKGMLTSGFIGGAHSIMLPAKDAFEVDLEVLKKNPNELLCDNFKCKSCYLGKLYNPFGIFKYIRGN
jgi:aminoglycoside 3-N-acetyltransferase